MKTPVPASYRDTLTTMGVSGHPEHKETCGPLFLRCMRLFTEAAESKILLFSAGHMTGQAEKIYLGACQAAMFRPSPEHKNWVLEVALHLSAVYGLEVSTFEREEIRDEIWLHSPQAPIEGLDWVEVNSPEWHELRGELCGIPTDQIDIAFHERKGHREVCDK